tara:strand:+ start:2555 stop:2851 length:297 start_codon:yes stop_codon:yes gene_type:complete
MSSNVTRIVFGNAPDDYDRPYFDDLTRSLNQFVTLQMEAGALRGTTLVLTNLPTSGNQLETGAVFNDQGTLKIALANTGYAPSFSITATIGTVTVTTS